MLKEKKAQVIGMTLSNMAMFFIILVIIVGLIFFTSLIYAKGWFSKDSIELKEIKNNFKNDLETQDILFVLLNTYLDNGESVKEKIIKLQTNSNEKFEFSEKDNELIVSLIEGYAKKFWGLHIYGRGNIILTDAGGDGGGRLSTVNVKSHILYLYSRNNKIKIILDIQK